MDRFSVKSEQYYYYYHPGKQSFQRVFFFFLLGFQLVFTPFEKPLIPTVKFTYQQVIIQNTRERKEKKKKAKITKIQNSISISITLGFQLWWSAVHRYRLQPYSTNNLDNFPLDFPFKPQPRVIPHTAETRRKKNLSTYLSYMYIFEKKNKNKTATGKG